MLTKKKGIEFWLFLCIAVVFIGLQMITVNASAKPQLDSFNSGVAEILDPTNHAIMQEAEEIVVEEENTYELVMANIQTSLNLREEPSEEALIMGKMYQDCGGEVLERANGWTKIQSGNLIGWTKDEYLLFGEEAEELANKVGYPIAEVVSDALRVRVEASEEAEVLGYAAKEENLVVISEVDETWICVEYLDGIGYVQREFVTEMFSIDHGETYDEITERELKEELEKNKLEKYLGAMTASEYELYLLAAIIYCESGGESYEGKLAVGAVVLNRVRSGAYPDTLQGVIYASGQFTPAQSGKLDRVMEAGNIPQSCFDAASEALDGYTNVGDALYFRRNNGTREGLVIGNHVFY